MRTALAVGRGGDGHLLEMNQRYHRDDEPGFRTGRGTAVAFKDPVSWVPGKKFVFGPVWDFDVSAGTR